MPQPVRPLSYSSSGAPQPETPPPSSSPARDRSQTQLPPLAVKPPMGQPAYTGLAPPNTDTAALAALAELEDEEDARILKESETYEVRGRLCVDDDETTPWLRYTKWPIRLAGKPLDIVIASTLQPTKHLDDYVLGTWAGRDFASPADDEAKLRTLMAAADLMLGRAMETLEKTHHCIRCWLKSYEETRFRPIPFTSLRTQQGQERYFSIWKQFICYVFRAWATEELLREEIYGVQFQEKEGLHAFVDL
ncbi:hypothetical protein V502_02257 [Pseudogymnoascus sp. VKM F-4520 (FW-2644)]|nr:hypothetical protein V502_02257 [Pseudogymnoascus sp. VKM F-4520 (FW-2644)]